MSCRFCAPDELCALCLQQEANLSRRRSLVHKRRELERLIRHGAGADRRGELARLNRELEAGQ